MKTKNRLLIILGIFLASCLIAVSCASSKPKLVVSSKIFDYYPVAYVSGDDFDWIYEKNVKITTLRYIYSKNNFVLYAQKIDDLSEAGKVLVLYFYPIRSDLNPIQNKLKVIGYVLDYRTGFQKKNLVTVHWIDCKLICNDKKLKSFLNRVF